MQNDDDETQQINEAAPETDTTQPAAYETDSKNDAENGEEQQEEKEQEAEGEAAEMPTEPSASLSRQATPQRIVVYVNKVVRKLHVSLGQVPEQLCHCSSFYIISNRPGAVAFEDMDAVLECGVLTAGPFLQVLEQALSKVYVPILTQLSGSDMNQLGLLLSAGTNNTHKELLSNMQKFLSQVCS